jgi:hypothetical protein
MWRAIFLAIGITLCIVGAECTVVEKAVLAKSPTASAPQLALEGALLGSGGGGPEEIQTAEWMPWFFVTLGIVVIIYTVTIPRRMQG